MNKTIGKMYVMNKTVLLTSASVIVFNVAAYASVSTPADGDFKLCSDTDTLTKTHQKMSHEVDLSKTKDLSTEKPSQDLAHQRLSAEIIVDFANFSYSVNKKSGWEESDKKIYNKLINDGWKLDPFNGSTGGADRQVESVSGLLAFKGDQVVIATRGTEMTNWEDWTTNFRFSRSPITRFFASEENNKLGAITAQFFGGVDGEVANGFLQTHLSSWDYIKEAIIKHAQSIGKSTQDLQYTITGHSKGAAKAQLNALNLLTDTDLAVGINYMERSFIFAHSDVADLGASGFYGLSKKSEPKNLGNVETVVFESPRPFSTTTAEQVNTIMGTDTLVRVENKSKNGFGSDPVTHVTPAVLGFAHAGTAVDVDSGFFVGRHMMENVGAPAIPVIEEHRANVDQKATSKVTNDATTPTAKEVSNQVKEVESTYFGKTVVNAFKDVGNAITSRANSFRSGVTSVAKKAWGYFWG